MNKRTIRSGWMVFGLSVGLSVLPVSAKTTLRVGLYHNPPKVAIGENGDPQGIFVDLLQAIANEESWSLDYVPGTWAEGLARLEAGTIDLMPDVAFTPDRDRRFAFHSEPVLSSWFQIYARRGSGIRSLVDFDGKRVAVLEASIQQSAFENMVSGFDLKTPLVSFPDYESAFAALADGRVDAVIANRFYDAAFLRGSVFEDTGIVFNPTRLYFAARPGENPDVLRTIDRQLEKMKQDRSSAYYQALHRWTGDEVRFQLPGWVMTAAIAGAATLLFILVWNLALNHRVAERTRELRLRIEENQRLYNILRDRAGELEKRVAERTDELILANGALLEAKEAAESADRLKSAFLATMSHELRTPLNSIIGFTGILLQKLPGPLNDEQQKQLGIVRDSARHLLALINDVLDISKIEAGQLEVVREPFDLPASIGKVAGIIKPLAEKKGLTLTVETAPETGAWTGDARRVEQILLNLLNNALKFTEQGGISLRTGIENGTLRLVVSDTGIGIPPEEQERIFLPFRQIDTGLSRRHEGTGLGLAICRRLAELMGGSIGLQSNPGHGSQFTLMLPAHGVPAA